MMRRRRRRALTYDDLPPEMKEAIQDYLRFTNESLRRVLAGYFQDKAATERRYGKLNTWDVGRVTDMSRLFAGRTDFNEARAGVPTSRRAPRSADSTPRISSTRIKVRLSQDIGAWDTSSVTTMKTMFAACIAYTGQGIGAWDISSVTSIKGMFHGCKSFREHIGAWDTASVTDMSYQFYGCTGFNADISATGVLGVRRKAALILDSQARGIRHR